MLKPKIATGQSPTVFHCKTHIATRVGLVDDKMIRITLFPTDYLKKHHITKSRRLNIGAVGLSDITGMM